MRNVGLVYVLRPSDTGFWYGAYVKFDKLEAPFIAGVDCVADFVETGV